jgi:succinoglycan biosynthesis transport protein ExoP
LIGNSSNLPAASQEPPPFEMPFTPEEEESGGGFTIRQVWLMLRAHMWLSIGALVLLLALAYVVIKNLPKSYNAQATLIVNVDNTDPLAGRIYPVGQTGTFFPTQVELIYNSTMLLPVIDKLKLQNDRNFTGGFTGDPKTRTDIVLENLRSSLDVKQAPGSQLLNISAMAPHPEQAAAIANAVAEEYLKQSRERINAPAIEKAERYSGQIKELRDKEEAELAKLTAFREKHGIADLMDSQGGDSEGAALRELNQRLLEQDTSIRNLRARLGSTGMEGSSADGAEVVAMRAELGAIDSQLAQMRVTLGPNHPNVQQKVKERQAKEVALQKHTTDALTRAEELRQEIQSAANSEEKRLLGFRKVQDEGAKLLLNYQVAKEAHANALRGQDAVEFAKAGDYKDVTMVSRAEPPVKSSKPNKKKLFLMAFVLSFGLAVGGPFAYELLLDRRIRCRDDLERSFRIVMLAEFGKMPQPQAG